MSIFNYAFISPFVKVTLFDFRQHIVAFATEIVTVACTTVDWGNFAAVEVYIYITAKSNIAQVI